MQNCFFCYVLKKPTVEYTIMGAIQYLCMLYPKCVNALTTRQIIILMTLRAQAAAAQVLTK